MIVYVFTEGPTKDAEYVETKVFAKREDAVAAVQNSFKEFVDEMDYSAEAIEDDFATDNETFWGNCDRFGSFEEKEVL